MRSGIFKDGAEVQDLEDWRLRAGPKRSIQWKDGRSAKENAKSWLSADGIPSELLELLRNHEDFGVIETWTAIPEAPVRIDNFRGEPPNIDVLINARDSFGPIAIVVEAKADETFGGTVGETLSKAKKRLETTPNSKGLERLERLVSSLFESTAENPEFAGLRYQLLTATGAALAEAERMESDRAVILIHEFISSLTVRKKRLENEHDFANFIEALSSGTEITQGLFGPITVSGSPLVDHPIKLYFGKAISNVRGDGV